MALRSICLVFFLVVILLGVPMVAGTIAGLFSYGVVDPDGAFAWISVHHLVQAAIFLAIIQINRKIQPLDFGLTWGNIQVGKQYVRRFTVVFALGTIVFSALLFMMGSFQPVSFPLSARNIGGYLGFQLLLSGPSEELIFRAFAITMFGLVLRGRVFGGRVSTANLAAAVVFGLAHVKFSISPLQFSYSPMQVLFSLGLGLVYGDCLEKTGSVFYPMIMHSVGNVLSVAVSIISSYWAL